MDSKLSHRNTGLMQALDRLFGRADPQGALHAPRWSPVPAADTDSHDHRYEWIRNTTRRKR